MTEHRCERVFDIHRRDILVGGAGGGLYGSRQAYHESPPIIRTVRINPDGFGQKKNGGKTLAKTKVYHIIPQ